MNWRRNRSPQRTVRMPRLPIWGVRPFCRPDVFRPKPRTMDCNGMTKLARSPPSQSASVRAIRRRAAIVAVRRKAPSD